MRLTLLCDWLSASGWQSDAGELPEKGGVKTTTKYEAAERLVTGFSAIPTEWVKIVAEHTGAEFYGIIWGTMFLVNDPVDKRRIQALLQPVEDEEDGDRLREPNWRLTLCTTRSMPSNNAKHLLSYCFAVTEHQRDALQKCQPANKLLDWF